MKYIKKHRKYFLGFVIVSVLILLGSFFYGYERSCVYNKSSNDDDTIPVPIKNWVPYQSNYGFSFMHPKNFEVKISDNLIKVGGISIEIEKMNCSNKKPQKEITSKTTLYGFKAEINESEKFAYICNNTNTACLYIKKDLNYNSEVFNPTKITEEFFHSFISSLNITKDFDRVSCF